MQGYKNYTDWVCFDCCKTCHECGEYYTERTLCEYGRHSDCVGDPSEENEEEEQEEDDDEDHKNT